MIIIEVCRDVPRNDLHEYEKRTYFVIAVCCFFSIYDSKKIVSFRKKLSFEVSVFLTSLNEKWGNQEPCNVSTSALPLTPQMTWWLIQIHFCKRTILNFCKRNLVLYFLEENAKVVNYKQINLFQKRQDMPPSMSRMKLLGGER